MSKWAINVGNGYFSGFEEMKATYVMNDVPGSLDEMVTYLDKELAEITRDCIGGEVVEAPE
ncbi:hypothetical protein [Carnobacterium pleistocenium]|uniref:hypothetical protein n=1 Tax=Carnobacterium pleistocenium TaxID=181073 RepID=UPI00054D445E|nr:hypothetical protein [Carnobacterium pleistocenium]